MVMAAYTAADLSAAINQPVDLPLSNHALATIADIKGENIEKVGCACPGEVDPVRQGEPLFADKDMRQH